MISRGNILRYLNKLRSAELVLTVAVSMMLVTINIPAQYINRTAIALVHLNVAARKHACFSGKGSTLFRIVQGKTTQLKQVEISVSLEHGLAYTAEFGVEQCTEAPMTLTQRWQSAGIEFPFRYMAVRTMDGSSLTEMSGYSPRIDLKFSGSFSVPKDFHRYRETRELELKLSLNMMSL